MSDIQQQIKVALEKERWTIPHNAIEWMTHQQQIIDQQAILIHQLRGALGYPVPWHIKENPDIINGIADAMSQQLEQQAAEIAEQKEYLRIKQDQVWSLAQERDKQAAEIERLTLKIQPGEIVDYSDIQFGNLNGSRLDRIQIHTFGLYAVLEHEGESYTVRYEKIRRSGDEQS